ncbi:MAG: SurA N-terminal domain-containing protein [Desulfosudaceae bacterium]
MLQFMRQRASSWMIKVILSVIVLAFVFMGVGNFRDKQTTVAAKVNGEEVSATAFQNRYYELLERVRRQFGDNLDDDMLERLNLKKQAMDQVVNERIVAQQAADYGLRVTDQELAQSISAISAFQKDGRFDRTLYNRVLQHNRMMPETFERRQRQQLLIDKMHAIITDGVKVAEDEARRWYNWQNTRLKINFVFFNPDSYQEVEPSEEAVEKFFEEHQQDYQSPARVKITYLAFAPEQYTDQAAVSDNEIEEYYQDNQDNYASEKTVEARHILIKAADDAPAELVEQKREEALEIYNRIKDGQDFAAAAREYSEGPSASDGGRLGAFKKDEMVAPFAEKAFSMEAGQVSKPVRTRFGWHLIKVDKVNSAEVKPLADVKDEIRERLARTKARDLAYEAALEAFDRALDENSVPEAARSLDLSAETTPLLSRRDRIKNIPDSDQLLREAFELSTGDISDVVEIDGGYYLFQVEERRESREPELETVRSRVESDLIETMRDEKAAAAAADLLAEVQNSNRQSLAEAADKADLTAQTTDYFKRGESVPEIGQVSSLSATAFQLTKDNPVADEVLAGKDGYYVISLADRQFPDEEEFAENRDKTVDSLRRQKKNQAFEQWLEAVKSRSDISIEERFLD